MKSQSDPVQIARMAGKLPVTITENAAKLEPEQDLRAKDQHARLIQGYLDFLESSIRVTLEVSRGLSVLTI